MTRFEPLTKLRRADLPFKDLLRYEVYHASSGQHLDWVQRWREDQKWTAYLSTAAKKEVDARTRIVPQCVMSDARTRREAVQEIEITMFFLWPKI